MAHGISLQKGRDTNKNIKRYLRGWKRDPIMAGSRKQSLGRRQARKLGLIPKQKTVALSDGTHIRIGEWAQWYLEHFGA